MKNNSALVNQLKRRLFMRLVLQRFCVWGSGYLLVWGGANLMLRAALDISPGLLLNGLAGLFLIFFTVLLTEWRHMPDRIALTALLDQYNHLGGLLMAADKLDTSSWLAKLKTPLCPQVEWRARRKGAICLLMTVFSTVTLFTPYYLNSQAFSNKLEIGATVQKLHEQVTILKEETLLKPDDAKHLEEQLEQVSQTAQGRNPARAYETLDHLNEQINGEAGKNVRDLSAKMATVDHAETLARLLANTEDLKPAIRTQAMQALTRMLQEISGDAANLASAKNVKLMTAIRNGAMTPEQMAALPSDLKSLRMKMAAKLKRLQASGMTTAQLGDVSSSSAAKPEDSGLKAFLKANAENLTMADISALCQNPGRGGVDRGRGDAIMTWKAPTSDKGARFRDVTTPLAGVAGIEESQPLGVTLAAPPPDQALPLIKSGALNEAAAGGGSALIHQVRPRHKGAVRRYFNRAPKETKPVRPDFFDEIWSGWS